MIDTTTVLDLPPEWAAKSFRDLAAEAEASATGIVTYRFIGKSGAPEVFLVYLSGTDAELQDMLRRIGLKGPYDGFDRDWFGTLMADIVVEAMQTDGMKYAVWKLADRLAGAVVASKDPADIETLELFSARE